MKRLKWLGILAILCAMAFLIGYSLPAWAIDDPSDTPSIEATYIYRNALETGDFLAIIVENTPFDYTSTNYTYSEAYFWAMLNEAGTSEIAQAVGYDYHDNGFNWNVIGFYFAADDAPDWNGAYNFQLQQNPALFDTPQQWTFSISAPGYSSLTDSDEVKSSISQVIIEIAQDLNNKWDLEQAYYLDSQTETGYVLSIYGEAFFRGALYGCQAYAPEAFYFIAGSIDSSALDDRTWTDEYSTNLTSQYSGTDFGTAMDAGNTGLGTSYNLFGLLITFFVIGVLWVLASMISGDWWGSIAICAAPLVIFTRMGMFGMGELALIAAIGWLWISAKMWKVI